jgi:hypothetical protein
MATPMTKVAFENWKRDMKRQIVEMEAAVNRKDWEFLDELANQISATGLELHSESREAN